MATRACDWMVRRGAAGGVAVQAAGLAEVLLRAPVWTNGAPAFAHLRSLLRDRSGWRTRFVLRFPGGTWDVEDRLVPRGDTLVIDRRWTWSGGRLASVRLGLDVQVPFRQLDFWALPYISMNGNRGARSAPAGMTCRGAPWVFREERTSAPALMTLESGGVVAGSYTESGRSERSVSSCSFVRLPAGHLLRTFFPHRESPCTYLGTGALAQDGRPVSASGLYASASGWANGLVLEGPARFRRRFFVVLAAAPEKRHGYVRVWESAWRNLRDPIAAPVRVRPTVQKLWQSLEPFWVSRGKVRGYSLRVDRDGDPMGSFSAVLSAGWCAPTMMLAWLALRRALRTGTFAPAERPIQAAEFFIRNAPVAHGIFRTHFDLKSSSWKDGDLDAVQLGGAAYWILRCVELLEGSPRLRQCVNAGPWLKFALAFCEQAVQTQRANGAFVAHWSVEGTPSGTERAMGVHAARAVLEAFRRTGDRRYLRAAMRGAAFYIRSLVDRESGYGDCTDLLESTTENDAAGVPDLLLDLYRITRRPHYLAKAVRAAEYSLSFLFAYNVHFAPETECGRRAMRTRGSAAISPETGFVSFFFAPQANTFLELWKETGEPRWKEYAVAVIRGTLQMMTEPGDTFGLAPHLIGCRAEVLPVLDTVKGAHVWKQGMTGYAWHQPVWWPAAFNLLNFAILEDSFPQVIPEVER